MSQSRWHPPERPKIRKDLLTQSAKQGKDVIYKLRTPESPSICLLHKPELRALRFMDGERDLDTIVSDASKAGLPMTRPQLEQFIKELAAYKFVENADPLPPWSSESFVGRADDPTNSAPGGLFSALAMRVVENVGESAAWVAISKSMQDPTRRKPVLIGAVAAVAVVVIVAAVVLVTRKKAEPGSSPPAPAGIAIEVHAAHEGVIEEISVHEGQKVAQGDALGRLSADSINADIEKLKADIKKAKADEAALVHKKGKAAKGAAQKRAALEQQAAADQSKIDDLQKQLSLLVIRAPVAGRVASVLPPSRQKTPLKADEVFAKVEAEKR